MACLMCKTRNYMNEFGVCGWAWVGIFLLCVRFRVFAQWSIWRTCKIYVEWTNTRNKAAKGQKCEKIEEQTGKRWRKVVAGRHERRSNGWNKWIAKIFIASVSHIVTHARQCIVNTNKKRTPKIIIIRWVRTLNEEEKTPRKLNSVRIFSSHLK